MSNELYFLPIIAKALESQNLREALEKTFAEINGLEKSKEFAQGFLQFELFMDEVKRNIEYKSIDTDSGEDKGSLLPVIELFRDSSLIEEQAFSEGVTAIQFTDIVPGFYQLRLNTGLIICEMKLTLADLLWENAFPDEHLELAAETEKAQRKPTKEIILLDGEIFLRVYAGIECGTIEIELAN